MFAVPTKKDLKMKDRADLLEAFIGALYVDKDLVIKSSNLSKIKSLSRLGGLDLSRHGLDRDSRSRQFSKVELDMMDILVGFQKLVST
jgi:hypothetical protein